MKRTICTIALGIFTTVSLLHAHGSNSFHINISKPFDQSVQDFLQRMEAPAKPGNKANVNVYNNSINVARSEALVMVSPVSEIITRKQ